MTGNGRSRVQDLRAIAVVLGVTGVIASAGWSIVSWATGLQSVAKAAEEHHKLKEEHVKFETKEHAREREKAIGNVLQTQSAVLNEVKDDMKVLRQRTYELVQDKRGQ